MRFLVDECTGPAVARWLRALGHDALSIFETARGLDDESILKKAFTEDRILITVDKDFGEMIYRERRQHRGVVLLRLADQRTDTKIAVLHRLLEAYADQLQERFVVVSATQVRFARE
jgi:predicted nuclease of predicted toxin-antitoxin system